MEEIRLPHRHGEGTALLQGQLDRVEYFQTVAEVFRQLADPTRIRIFWLLCHCEECVVNLSAMMRMSSPAVSHHLRTLKNTGLILSRREGKEVYYRAADTGQGRLLHRMIERVMEITCPAGPLSEEPEQAAPEPAAGLSQAAAGMGAAPPAALAPVLSAGTQQAPPVHSPAPAQPPQAPQSQAPQSLPEAQLALARAVHSQLLQNIDQRVTIEELARQHLVNPTTLKEAFKAVYGTSLAAHIRQHRMEQAAALLRQTEMTVAEIAQAVGYDSQSRFTAAFKAVYGVLPRDWRKTGGELPECGCCRCGGQG